jgi:hypothetical protein
MRRRWGFRGWAIVWAVLQFALPAAATFADALLERDAATARTAHVESGSSEGCRPVHPAECALCQVVSRSSAPTAYAPSWRDAAGVVPQPPIEELRQCALDGLRSTSLARAPPLG